MGLGANSLLSSSYPFNQLPNNQNSIMRKIFLLLSFITQLTVYSQPALYKKSTVMIPMRDGIKLYTVIYSPINLKGEFPFMIERTPYGAFDRTDNFDFSRIPAYAD